MAGPLRAGEPLTDRRLLGPAAARRLPTRTGSGAVPHRDAGVVDLLEVGDRIDVYAARRDTTAADRLVAGGGWSPCPDRPTDSDEGALVVLAVTSGARRGVGRRPSATSPLSLTLLR